MIEKTTADYERDTIEIIRDMTQDWDTGFDEEFSASTAIVGDLEFESLDVVHLITAIEQHYEDSSFPFEELLMVDGHYIQDLTVKQIAEFVYSHRNGSSR